MLSPKTSSPASAPLPSYRPGRIKLAEPSRHTLNLTVSLNHKTPEKQALCGYEFTTDQR